MNSNYILVAVWLILSCTVCFPLAAQMTAPEFPDCNQDTVSLCVADEGVRLPSNNKVFLGEENPDATSCSVHVTQRTKVWASCGTTLLYMVQLIVNDTSAPFLLKSLTPVTTDSLQEAELTYDSELSPEAWISQSGIPYTTGCSPYHRIRWSVVDSCGNTATCENWINVYDCFAPITTPASPLEVITFNCDMFHSLSANNLLSMILDDCGDKSKFLYSFKKDAYKPDTSFYQCDVPAMGVELPFVFWIGDEGIDFNCDGEIEWTERRRDSVKINIVYTETGCVVCEPPYPTFIQGEILTEDLQPVKNVTVTLSSSGTKHCTYLTGIDGKYYFNISHFPAEYQITAERNDHFKNGVSTLDWVRIWKHLLGLDSINSPYDLIAADVNYSQNISAIDMIALRKVILNIDTVLPHQKSWRFIDKAFEFTDPLQPWPLDEEINIAITGTITNLNFVAVKIGDLNNTVEANLLTLEGRQAPKSINWNVNNQEFQEGEIIEINFSMSDARMIEGFQFTVSASGLEIMDAYSSSIDLTEGNFALFGDKITMSWFDVHGKQFEEGETIFTLKARAKEKGSLQQSLSLNLTITAAEVYSSDEEILIPRLFVFEENMAGNITAALHPNPWREGTFLPIRLSETGTISLEIFDLSGRCVYTRNENLPAGNTVMEINADEFKERGLLYYSLQSDEWTITNKMVVLE